MQKSSKIRQLYKTHKWIISLWQLSYSSSSRWTLFSFVPDFPCALPGFTCKKRKKKDFLWHFKFFDIDCAISCIKISCMYKKILERKKTGDNKCFQKLLAGTKKFPHNSCRYNTDGMRANHQLTTSLLSARSKVVEQTKKWIYKERKEQSKQIQQNKNQQPCFQHSQFTIFRTL